MSKKENTPKKAKVAKIPEGTKSMTAYEKAIARAEKLQEMAKLAVEKATLLETKQAEKAVILKEKALVRKTALEKQYKSLALKSKKVAEKLSEIQAVLDSLEPAVEADEVEGSVEA